MLTSTVKRTGIALICSFLFIVSASAPATLAGKPSAVVVVDYEVSGNAVLVSVKNNTHKPRTCEVHVYATLEDGSEVRGFTPVTLSSGGTVDTVVGFVQTLDSLEKVAIIEDANPI